MKSLAFVFMAAFLFLAAAPARAGETRTFVHDGQERHFIIHRPESTHQAPFPAILVFHGGGGNPQDMERITHMVRQAAARGYIVVYPAGTGKRRDRFLTWNAGDCCGPAKETGTDDVGYVAKLIDILAASENADPARIYATGLSNGAMMAYRLACELPERIAAIAPVAGQEAFPACRPDRPVPVLHFHGTADRCANFAGAPAGGQCGGCFTAFFAAFGIPLRETPFNCLPVAGILDAVARRNGCALRTETAFENGAARCMRYQGCPARGEVFLCLQEGAGHVWPGGENDMPLCATRPAGKICREWRNVIGPDTGGINATAAMLDFFSRHRLPQPPEKRQNP